MGIKQYLVIASYALTLFIGWHGHTWYDGYVKSKGDDQIIDGRIAAEKASNADAANTAKKEADDEEKSRKSDAVVQAHINQDQHGYDCAVPHLGVLDLQQAVTTHTGTRKPH